MKLGRDYKVNFNLNYGGKSLDAQVVFEGEKAVAPEKPVCKGFTFIGWFTEAVGGEEFDFDTAIDKDVTLFAHWEFSGRKVVDPIHNIIKKAVKPVTAVKPLPLFFAAKPVCKHTFKAF